MVRSLSFLLAAVMGLVAITGCFMPLFDLETSLAYQTASKMTKIATVGPIGDFSRDRLTVDAEIYYVPSRMSSPDHGLAVILDNFGATYVYLAPDTSEPGNPVRQFREETKLFDGTDATNFKVDVAPIVDTAVTVSDAFFVATDAQEDAEIAIVTYDGVGNVQFTPVSALSILGAPYPSVNAEVLGISLDVDTTAGIADYLVVLRDSVVEPLVLFPDSVNNVAPPAGPLAGLLPAVLPTGFDTVGGSLAYDSADGIYVYSDYQGGGFYDVYRSTVAGEPEVLPVRQRIDAILDTGELYHRGANSDEVYDANGRRKHSIPMGKLHFAYEITIASVPTMFYTLVYFDEVGDRDDDNMYIDIYAIPTADLNKLE